MNYSGNDGLPSLSDRLEHLVGNSLHSDFTFIVEDDDVEIPAHKLIIALASPVIDRIVYGSVTFTSTNSIRVDSISSKSFMEILRYIYTDKINITEDNVIEVLHKANYFGLLAIETKCCDYLKRNLNVSSVPWIFHHLFHTSSSPELLKKCLQYIRVKPLSFFAADEFPSLSIVAFKIILQMEAINCTEVNLFEALVKLARSRCIVEGLHPTGANQRKVLDGADNLLRLDSLTACEFDNCLTIEPDFFTTKEIEQFRDNLDAMQSQRRRKFYTYQKSVWLQVSDPTKLPSSRFSYDSTKCIYRCQKQGDYDTPVSDNFYELLNMREGSSYTIEILCGSGYEWRRCVNGEIPFGAVPLSQENTATLFIGRGYYSGRRGTPHIAPVYISGKMYIPEYQRYNWIIFVDDDESTDPFELSLFDILVANNVKNAYTGNGIPNDAIFIGSDENNFSTYLGRAWYSNELLPAKGIFENEVLVRSYVSYDHDEIEVDEFEFLRIDPGTFKWEEAKNGEVPENAIIGGRRSDETLYFGRCFDNGTYIHGVIHQSQRNRNNSYFTQGRQVYSSSSYEYLITVNDGMTEILV